MSKIKANTIENVAGTESHSVDTMGIESGSNANGNYTKFPDGTLICYSRRSGSDGTFAYWTFPYPFANNAPTCTGASSESSSSTLIGVKFHTPTVTGINFAQVVSGSGLIVSQQSYLIAIGRWK